MTSVKPHDKLWCHIIIFESFANMFTDFYYVTLWDVHLEADFDWLLWQKLKRTPTVASADDSLLRPALGESVVTVLYPYNQHMLMDTGSMLHF